MSANIRLGIVFTILSVSCLSRSYPANAGAIHVPQDFGTIQSAIDSSSNGDTVLVEPGIYLERINFKGKGILLTSRFLVSGDTGCIASTIIDANESGSVVTFNNNEDSNCVLSGFTIQNGLAIYGGGIYADNASPILINLLIRSNKAAGIAMGLRVGGGVYFNNSQSQIINSRIADNVASGGAGVYCRSSDLIFKCVEITDNLASSGDGGGIFIDFQSFVTLINATIADDIADDRYFGIYCLGASKLFIRNTIFWNPPRTEIYLWGEDANSLTISYSAVRDGKAAIGYKAVYVDSIFWEEGNIDADPLFLNSEGFDYRLESSSPCINSGTPDTTGLGLPLTDLAGNPRIVGGRIDMGAYEYQVDPPPTTEFIITPATGTRETTFQFDASSSSDTKDPASSLLVRWDWQGDGAWDTDYSAEKTEEHTYAEAGIYTVTLEVKDTDGFTTRKQRTLIVANDFNRELTYTLTGDQGSITAPFLSTSLSLRFLTGSVAGKSISIAGFGDSLPDSVHSGDRFEKAVGYYALSSEDIASFSGTLKFTYSDSIITALSIPEDSLRIAFYDETLSKWRAAVTTINKDSNSASATIDHFSLWALTDRSDDLITQVDDIFSNPGAVTSYQLRQNYPNPFNPVTFIRFSLPKEERVRITLYNILGQKVRLLSNEPFSPGEHTVAWDGRDDSGRLLASGVYIYEIRAGEFIERKKMTLLR